MSLKEKVSLQRMAEMVNPPNNMPLSEIGNRYNVSRQRVHQVLQEYKRINPDVFIEIEEPTKEEIEKLLDENITLEDIATDLNITTNQLRRHMEKHGLKRKFIKDILDKETLYDLYVIQEMTDEQIAKNYNCSKTTVAKLRYQHEIFNSMRKSLGDKITKDIFVDLYVKEGLLLSQMSEVFDVNIQSISNLKQEYKIDKLVKGKENLCYRAVGVSDKQLEIIKDKLIKKGVI